METTIEQVPLQIQLVSIECVPQSTKDDALWYAESLGATLPNVQLRHCQTVQLQGCQTVQLQGCQTVHMLTLSTKRSNLPQHKC